MMRFVLAALVLAACTPTTVASQTDTSGPLDGFWEIETTQLPDSGCTFRGVALMERIGTSVQYRVVITSAYVCPGREPANAVQMCDAYDLTVLQVDCTVDPDRSTAGYLGDNFNMLRPLMQARVDQMEGSIRLPESEYERLRGADYIMPHLLRWTRHSSQDSSP